MRIPIALALHLHRFVQEHCEGSGLVGRPAEIGSACERETESWLSGTADGFAMPGDERVMLMSAGGRFGKHLAVFFLNEREG